MRTTPKNKETATKLVNQLRLEWFPNDSSVSLKVVIDSGNYQTIVVTKKLAKDEISVAYSDLTTPGHTVYMMLEAAIDNYYKGILVGRQQVVDMAL